MDAPVQLHFGTVDLVIFVGLFVLSTAVGGVFAYLDRKKQSTENYYFGGRVLSPIPVAISISVSYVSALAMIGFPAEVYYHGVIYVWFCFGYILSTVFAVLYYIPLFHRLQISSVYEYLELRFHRWVRLTASIAGILSTTAFLAIAIFLPALALSAVTPMKLTWTIVLTSVVCTLYTSMGGLKAVIWVDVLQCLVMVSGAIALLVNILMAIGGWEALAMPVERGGRNNLFKFDFDPRVRSTVLSTLTGGTIISCYEILCNQIFIQRWISCKSVATARKAVLLSVIPTVLFGSVSVVTGLAAYAYYEGCDPLLSKKISTPDQLLPQLSLEIFQNRQGLAGLFVSAAFCGTMSSVSSGINALSAVILMDFCLPNFPNLSDRKKLIVSKFLTVAFGLVVMTVSYLVSLSSSNAVEIAAALEGFFAGPVLGVFTMGLFMPWINYKSVLTGFSAGLFCVLFAGISSMVSPNTEQVGSVLPMSIENCTKPWTNYTTHNSTIIEFTYQDFNDTEPPLLGNNNSSIILAIASLSPFMYGILGVITSILGAHVACIFFGCSDLSTFDSRLFTPVLKGTLLPRKFQKLFQCGVPEYKVGKTDSSNDNGNLFHQNAKQRLNN